MPGIDWDRRVADLLRTVEEEEMTQLVSFPTHTKGGVLDLLITNCAERIVSIREEGRLGKSDHSIILLRWRTSHSQSQKKAQV